VKLSEEQLEELISACVKGKKSAQEKLFKLYYGKMLAVCLRYMKDRDSAQEILQEGFIKLFEKLDKYDFKGSFDGWLRRIMVNTAIDAIRRSKRDPFLVENEVFFFQSAGEDHLEDSEEMELTDLKAEMAIEAIQQLSPAYQTVFNLYVIEDYSHKEIAEKLGISEGTSKSNLAKAKTNLKKYLQGKFNYLDKR
jgi:RNA polymerase sigma-70 factor (ECF subfamily)